MFKNNFSNENDIFFYKILKQFCINPSFIQSDKYIQHGNTSVLIHSIVVAYYSYQMALFFNINIDKEKLIRGALLHDYFLYDWHDNDASHRLHGFRHPFTALKNAERDFELSDIEKNIIKRHMFPLVPIPPKYSEAVIVCIIDKICSILEIFNLCSNLKCYNIDIR